MKPSDKFPQVDLAGLIQLARSSYDHKRRKECLALTSAILKIDPASNEARVLQSLIDSDIQQALQRIHTLMKNPRLKYDEELRTNAYQLLQSVLDIDPENKAANALLPEIDPTVKPAGSPPLDPKTRPESEKRTERPGWTPPEVGPPETFPTDRPKNSPIRYAVILAVVLAIAALAIHFGIMSTVQGWFGR
jgi:hypothetical protein